LLNEIIFFRSKRRYPINVDVVDRLETDYMVKLRLNLSLPEKLDITKRKDKAAEFKRWIEQ
jgi:hypothetical protein